MSFAASSENIRVDEGHILRASLRNVDGDLVDAELDLDQVLGNNYGPSQHHRSLIRTFQVIANTFQVNLSGEEMVLQYHRILPQRAILTSA
jgi:hypothetical protein